MCDVCRQVKRLSNVDALQLIGQVMAGASKKEQEHLLDLADSVSDEGEEPHDDHELAREWERILRGG